MNSTRVWAEYLGRVKGQRLPASVQNKARLHLLDTLAAVISGHELAAGRAGLRLAQRLGGRSEATVLSTPLFKCDAIQAALANAMAAHGDETDDSHLRGRFHPGCSIVPTALAAAELFGSSVEQLLNAVAAGYDFGARAVMALGFPEHEAARFSTHTIGGQWGAAAAALALAPLSTDQIQWALSYTAQQVSGIPYWRKDKEHIEKSFDFGAMAARNALFTVLAVQAGWTGCTEVLEGPESYLSAFGFSPDAAALTAELGQRFEIEAATIKKWCVGSPIQAVLDSTQYLIDQHGVRARDVQHLCITMPDDRMHIVDNRDMPDVCVQHLVAVALIDGTVGFHAAHDRARMHAPEVLALRQKINLEPSHALTMAKPARQATVAIELHGGERLSRHTVSVLGTPENPMSDVQVEEKVRDLVTDLLGKAATDRLIRAWDAPQAQRSVIEVLKQVFSD
jgi:2-methylcitrate dehydratase PrpD